MLKNNTVVSEIEAVVKDMPYFKIEDLNPLNIKSYYLRIALSRMKKKEEIVSLKRGTYVSKNYLEKMKRNNTWNNYLEFLSCTLYSPSYLSLEYVLNEHNVLSESSFGFSSISTKKTNHFKNNIGNFYYYNVKDDLFAGFSIHRKNDFIIYKASLGKALFDFLYLRKNIITSSDFLESLRINKDQIKEEDFLEFKKYVEIEGSKKMKKISKFYE